MAQQIAVIECPQAEVFEPVGTRRINGRVELAGIGLDEIQHALIDQADIKAKADGLGKGVHAQALHLLIDEGAQQPRGQP